MRSGASNVSVSLLSLLLIFAADFARPENAVNNLEGKIEILSGGRILEANLSTGKTQNIFSKNEYHVNSFDVSPQTRNRIIAVTENTTHQDSLVLLTDNEEVKTLFGANSLQQIRSPSISPDGKQIAFLFRREEQRRKNWFRDWYLYYVNKEGTQVKRATELILDWVKPSWFPDGKQLVIATKDLGIYIVDKDADTVNQVVDFGTAPTVSHDGRKIAYLSKELNSAQKQKILDFRGISFEKFNNIALTKQGTVSEVVREMEEDLATWAIYVYNVKSKEKKKLTNKENIMIYNNNPIVWSPDDRYLIYSIVEDIPGKTVSYILDIEKGGTFKAPFVKGTVMAWIK